MNVFELMLLLHIIGVLYCVGLAVGWLIGMWIGNKIFK
jgi:uncharacterized membrane protein YciS (DUF1049 family)